MKRVMLGLLVAFVYACGGSEGPRSTTGSGGAQGSGEAASYARNFILLSRQADAPVAAVLDFTADENSDSIHRSAAAWLLTDGAWRRLLQASWQTEPVREPWRLVPHEELRLLVGDRGEIEALVHRADSTGFRLVPSVAVAEWSAGDAAQFRLRRGELRLQDRSIVGVLLDLQTGARAAGAATADVAFLTDGEGAHLILAENGTGSISARLFRDAEELVWEELKLTPLAAEVSPGAEGAVHEVADAEARTAGHADGWRIAGTSDDFAGELRATGDSLDTPAAGAGAGVQTVVVDGWIEARGERRTVFGVVRRGRE